MTSKAEDDVYLSQLRDVFDSCDTSGTGYLGRGDLKLLCGKLQLGDTADLLGTRLLGEEGEARVTFDEFKEAFLTVLSETVEEKEDELSEDTEEDLSDIDVPGLDGPFEFEEEEEVSPKYVKDGKKYGRHSRPGTDTEGSFSESHSAAKNQGDSGGATNQKSPGDKDRTQRKDASLEGDFSSQSSTSGEESKAETFEAEGQLNQSISEMENILDQASEEEHLRAIWRDLGVGKSGSLTLSELAVVCEHIGMEEMDQEELGHLFNKLDEDGDGLVSFHEFLRGLFQHSTPATPIPTLSRSASAPRQFSRAKLKLSRSASNVEDRSRTPTFFLSSGSGIFSSIDVDNSGFARPESIIELWDSLNVPQGPDIFEYLEFDMNTKINLADLSYVLEQELHSVEEDNATYQAAIATYEHEQHYVKSTQEQARAEITKLKSDLAEANSRISLLVKEGDERHITLEKSRDRELLEVERKYQEQIKKVQNEGELDRDNLLHQTSQQNSRLHDQIDALKRQENELRENLALAQKDLERVEKEGGEMAERCRQLERQTFRQQKELEAAGDLQAKINDFDKHQLDQLELNREVVLDESQRFLEEKLKQIRTENQELKDKNDELTMEVEQMRQQLQSARRLTGTSGRSQDGASGQQPQRSGSLLSDYTKPVIETRRADSVSDTSEDDGENRPRRKLPQTPSDTDRVEVEELRGEVEELQAEIDGLKRERDELDSKRTREVAKLQRCLSAERLDLEQKYKLEISDLEDTYLKEKELIIKTFTKQKEEMAKKLEEGHEVTLREREKELERRVEDTLRTQEKELEGRVEETLKEREELLQRKWEVKKKEMEEEQSQLIVRLKTEHMQELHSKLKEQAEQSARELEEVMSVELSEYDALRLQKSEIELRLKLLREEMSLQCEQEKLALTETWQAERLQLEEKYAAEISNYDNMLSLGANGLKGKLKEDFHTLLERHKEMLDREKTEWQKEVSEQQMTQLQQLHAQEEKQQLLLDEKQKNKIEKMLTKEKNKLEKTFKVKLQNALENEKKELENAIMEKYKEEYQKREHDLEKTFKVQMQNEKKDIEKVVQEKCDQEYQKAKADLERSFKEKFAKMEESQAESSMRAERSRLEEEKAGLKKKMETDLCHTIERRLEMEFAGQLRQVKEAFNEERSQLLTRVASLQRELEESQHERDHEQRQWKDTLEQEKWERRVTVTDDFEARPKEWNGDHSGEVERLQRTLLEERSRARKNVDELEQRCFHLQADYDTTKQELKQTQQKLQNLRQEPKVPSQQKSSSPQASAGDNSTDRKESYQDEVGRLEAERDELRAQLEIASNMLAESSVALSVSDSEHVRELVGVHEQTSHMMEVSKYNDLEAELAETRQRLSESEALGEQRAAETNKLLITSHRDQERVLQELQQQNRELQQRLNQTDSLLHEQVNKLRLQMERSARTDMLLKELYVENAELVKCLGVTEEREKGARTAAHRLDEKCRALQRVLRRVVPAAVC